jgi:cyclopropane fatty-acyl-phospholipid synthase-like methyltransferase
MKIYITENIENIIDGYIMIPIVYGKIDISNLPNNSIEEIVAIDAIDSIVSEELGAFFTEIKTKLRLNGVIHISGIELAVLCNSVLNGSVNSKDFNDTIFNSRSISCVDEILNYIKMINLEAQTVAIKGNKYEITAKRTN